MTLSLLPHEPWAPCKARWVWAGTVTFASATCSLHFAKASAATLLQQEKGDSADLQLGRLNISNFISPTHKRTEGRAPVTYRCGALSLLQKDAALQGGDPAETAVG
jgi:hypothetical protein